VEDVRAIGRAAEGAKMKKVQVDTGEKKYEFELRQQDGRLFIKQNGAEYTVDLVRLGNNRYSLILSGRSHEIGADYSPEGYTIFSRARAGHFIVEDYEIARMKKKAGIDDGDRFKKIMAPMPGMIVTVMCQVGEEVKKGQPLLVMEAMKMENDIKSPAPGKIKSIGIENGFNVDKGQVLIEFE
jgi:biotin carboxyl carrier protein